MKHEAIWILDFGSQYTQLIARRVRECGVYCEIKPCTEKAPETIPPSVVGIVLSGGPASVLAEDAPEFDVGWLRTSMPILGICYGMQLLARLGGGDVRSGRSREYGPAQVLLSHGKSALFEGLTGTSPQMVWMSHGDHVAQVPNGFEAIAHSENGILAAMSCEPQQRYGLQFHPEVTHTVQGKEVLENFVLKICGAKGDWTAGAFIDEQVALIRDTVGKNNVICGLSGGVDSSVVAALLHRAIPDQLYCIFVDNGLCRENESMDLKEDFVGYNIKIVDAQKTFLSALEGVSDPEAKRKIIGETFIRVFEKEASAVPNALYLAQGTLYPDVIESVSVQGPSATIKSHHNVGGLPEDMIFELIEPLRELFKDEVRAVGALLGLPEERVWRHPFPGPGLAVRCLGDLVEFRLAALRRADAIFIEEIKRAGLYRTIWQAFAVLLPVKSVGVMGDERTYEEVCVLRAVTSHDGMTADWVEMPYEVLGIASSRIINEIKGINRVAYDISSKPPATIEWE